MFGNNEIVGKKYFQDKASDVLTITTNPFATLQGEGPLSGTRSVFVRLAKCQLACSFCDTYFDHGEDATFDQIEVRSRKAIEDWMTEHALGMSTYSSDWNLVITGGEPFIQPNLFAFINKILGNNGETLPVFNQVQVESNGIVDAGDLHMDAWLVVSPKCSEKNGIAMAHLKPHPRTLDRADCLKFVVTADKTSGYHNIPDWAITWMRDYGLPVYVSPMNMYLKEPQAALAAAKSNKNVSIEERTILERISFWEEGLLDMEANQRNHEYAAELCMKHGFILSLQTHLLASLP